MKKLIKNITLLTLAVGMLMTLTACGKEAEDVENNNEQSENASYMAKTNNVLIATTTYESDEFYSVKEIIEIRFKNDKASEVKYISEFENEEIAQEYYELMKESLNGIIPEEFGIEQEDERVIISMSASAFAVLGGDLEGWSKEEIKLDLEGNGYIVEE